MNAKRAVTVLTFAILCGAMIAGPAFSAGASESAEQEKAVSKQQETATEESAGEAGGIELDDNEVVIVKLEVKGRTIKGKLVSENEKLIKIQKLGSGEIGYSRTLVDKVERQTVTKDVYYEMVGDYYANRTWDFQNDLEDFIQARKNYARALAHAGSDERKEELREKYEQIKEQRKEWEKEKLKQEVLRKAEEEAEIAELEKEMKLKELDDIRSYQLRIRQLEDMVAQLSGEVRYLRSLLRDVDDDLRYRDRRGYWYRRGYYRPYPYYYYFYYRHDDDDEDGDGDGEGPLSEPKEPQFGFEPPGWDRFERFQQEQEGLPYRFEPEPRRRR